MDPFEPYRPRGDIHEMSPPLATTGAGPPEDLLQSKTMADAPPGDTRATRVVSVAGSAASTRTNASSRLRERIRRDVQWGTKLHWFLPSAMVGLFILGLLGALLHHWFYISLDGEGAEDQLIMVGFGTAFAFFTKAALVGSIVLAYRQRIWYTLRTEAITVKGIDRLFALTEDPTCFASKDVVFKAKVAAVMALATWIIPFAAVLSPGALTARQTHVASEANCVVPTFNTSAQNDAIPERPKHGLGGYDLLNFNRSEGPGRLLYLDDLGYTLTQSSSLSFILRGPRELSSPCRGYNCTWNVGFDAPWYECQEKSVAEARKAVDTMDWGRVNTGGIYNWAPRGQITLAAMSDGDEYAPSQPPYGNGSANMQGYFVDEPTIRVGYLVDTKIPVEEGSVDSHNGTWKTVFEPHWLSCDLFKASWNVTFNFTDQIQSASVKTSNKRRVFVPPKMGPSDPGYRENALYYAFGRAIRIKLSSAWGFKLSSEDKMQFSAYHPLVNETTRLAINDVKGGVEKLVSDLALTLLAIPYLEIALNTTVECKKWRYENRFHYNRRSLWIGYAISIFATLVFVIIGMHSIYINGITSDTLFSKVLVTTRNPTLDKLVRDHEGVCLGGDPFPEVLEQTRLRFGIIDRGDGGTHTAFGTVDETSVMLGSKRYRGLEDHRIGQEAMDP